MEIEKFLKIIELSHDVKENASYLTYTVNPIGTKPSKQEILKDIEEIRKLLNQIEDLL